MPDIYIGWLDPVPMFLIDQGRLEAAHDELRAQGRRELSTWLPSAVQARCRTRVAVGQTADTILQVAQEERADVIVMRSPKRWWWRPFLAASVTDMVRRNAAVPVVIWDGLEPMAATGLWPERWPPHAPALLQRGVRPERHSVAEGKTPSLKSRCM